MSRVRCEDCTKSVAKSQSVLGWMNKFKLYLEMGGKCVACGNQEVRALVIDHVYYYNHHTGDNGKIWNKLMLKSRRSTKSRLEVLQGYKEGKYQLLCSNCNRLKELKRIGCNPYIKLALAHKYYPNDQRTYSWGNRFDLLKQMGGCCFDCGVRELAVLEIHHSELFHHSMYHKEWESIRVKLRRNKNYRREILTGYKHGKYFLLCCNCNRRDALKQRSEPFIQEALARLERSGSTNTERNIIVDNYKSLRIILANIIFLLCIFIFLSSKMKY
jgi:hypothetical protein